MAASVPAGRSPAPARRWGLLARCYLTRSLQFSRVPKMAVNALRIERLELIDGQICHTMIQHGDSTIYYSRIGDRHLRYSGTLRSFPPHLSTITDAVLSLMPLAAFNL